MTNPLLNKFEELIGQKILRDEWQDLSRLCDRETFDKFIAENNLPPRNIKHLIVTTEHSGYRVTGGIGSYVQECDHLYGKEAGILIIDSNRDVDMVKITDNKWFTAQTFLNPDRIDVIDSANYDTVGDLVYEVLIDLLQFYPNILSIEFQEMLGNRSIEAKKIGLIPENIRLITTCHGSSFHLAKAKRDVIDPENVHVAYREKFTVEESDITIFPTNFLRESYRDSGLANLDDESRIIKRLPFDTTRLPKASTLQIYKRLVYIGKTSTIKGFDLFLGTLIKLHADYPDICKQLDEVVVFATYTDITEIYLRDMLSHVRSYFNIRIVSMDREELLVQLAEYGKDSLALITYKGDNHPLTVLELMAIGHDFLAAQAGGTPELIPDEFKKDYLVNANETAFVGAIVTAFKQRSLRQHAIQRLSKHYLKEQRNINESYSTKKLLGLSTLPTNTQDTEEYIINIHIIDTDNKKDLKRTLESLEVQTRKPEEVNIGTKAKTTNIGKQVFTLRLYAGDTLHPQALELMSKLMMSDSTTGAVLAYENVPTYHGHKLKGIKEYHPFAPELGSVFLQEKYHRRVVALFKGAPDMNEYFSDWHTCIALASRGKRVRIVPKLLMSLAEIEDYVEKDLNAVASKMAHSFKALPVFDAYILYSQLKRLDDIYWGARMFNHLEEMFIRKDDPTVILNASPALTKVVHVYRTKTPKHIRGIVKKVSNATFRVVKKVKNRRTTTS